MATTALAQPSLFQLLFPSKPSGFDPSLQEIPSKLNREELRNPAYARTLEDLRGAFDWIRDFLDLRLPESDPANENLKALIEYFYADQSILNELREKDHSTYDDPDKLAKYLRDETWRGDTTCMAKLLRNVAGFMPLEVLRERYRNPVSITLDHEAAQAGYWKNFSNSLHLANFLSDYFSMPKGYKEYLFADLFSLHNSFLKANSARQEKSSE